MNFPIYVISLKRATERRASICRRLDAAGVQYELIDAVDGKNDLSKYRHRVRADLFRKHYQQKLYPGNIACTLSHIKVWQKISDEKTEVALILEDDAAWDDDLFKICDAVINCDWQWDMAMLSHVGGSKKYQTLEELSPPHKLVRMQRPGWGMVVYLVRLSGAEKILPQCKEIYFGADNITHEYWRGGLQIFDVIPNPGYITGVPSIRTGHRETFLDPMPFRKSSMRAYRKIRRWLYHLMNPPKRKVTENRYG